MSQAKRSRTPRASSTPKADSAPPQPRLSMRTHYALCRNARLIELAEMVLGMWRRDPKSDVFSDPAIVDQLGKVERAGADLMRASEIEDRRASTF